MVSYSNLNLLLVKVAVCCPFVQSSSPTIGRESWLVDGAASEWIPIISGVPHRIVLGPILFILNTSEMFAQVQNRLFAYADYSTLLEVVRKPADKPAVAAFLTVTWLGFRSGAITGA